MAIFPGSAIPSAAEDYTIDNSLRFNDGDSAYLSRTPSTNGNRKTWTFSCWFKKCKNTGAMRLMAAADDSTFIGFQFSSSEDVLRIDSNGNYNYTTAVYRDPSAWYHLVVSLDTTQATTTDRRRAWINGEEVSWSNSDVPTQDGDSTFNYTSQAMSVGSKGGSSPFDGYIAECYFLDGTGVTDASDFGELSSTTNQWIPKDASGLTFGTNGFYQKYGGTEDADVFTDSSGGIFQGSDFAAVTSSMTFSVGNVGMIIDGNTSASSGCIPTSSQTVSAQDVTFDCGSGVTKIFTHAEFILSNTYNDGVWKWQGSNDDVSYSDIGSGTFTVQGATSEGPPIDITGGLSSNTTAYRYYRWQGVSGTTTASNYWTEIVNLRTAPPGTGFHTITDVGDVTNTRAVKKVGDSSIKFDGTGDYLTVPDSPDWALGTGDFTVEFWLNHQSVATGNSAIAFSPTDDYRQLFGYVDAGDGLFKLYLSSSGGGWDIASGVSMGTAALDSWKHYAVVRSGTSFYTFQNGTQISTFTSSSSMYSANTDELSIGRYGGGNELDGYMDEIRISNTARYTGTFTDFGQGGGTISNPTAFTSDINTLLLIHSNWDGGLGADSSGNYNNFTPTNLVATDQMIDTPTNNFATWDPLCYSPNTTFKEGNLEHVGTSASTSGNTPCTFTPPATGKWYWEEHCSNINSTQWPFIGTVDATVYEIVSTWSENNGRPGESESNGGWKIAADGEYETDGGGTSTGGQGFNDTTDIIQFALDHDNGALYYGVNNTWYTPTASSGDPTSGASKTGAVMTWTAGTRSFIPAVQNYNTSALVANFGQDSSFAGNVTAQGNQDGNGKGDFYYEPPTDYLALCTDNLSADLDITLPGEYFNTLLYTGTGATNARTGLGFQPDFTWIKRRSVSTTQHMLFDSIRLAPQYLVSDATDAEATDANQLESFDSDGFTVGSGSSTNGTSATFVGWNWKAGTANSGATSGSGTLKTYSSSTSATAGFSIIKYVGNGTTGHQIPHHMGVAPQCLIAKNLDRGSGAGSDWHVWHTGFGTQDKYIWLNQTNPAYASSNYFNAVSSTTFSLGTDTALNADDEDIVCYAFTGIEGYSKFGFYEGNGDADGAFVYTGFSPAMVIIKNMDDTQDWSIIDNKRPGYNEVDEILSPNLNSAEDAGTALDFTSNGFKCRNGSDINNDAKTMIYIAFAESPFKYSNAR